MPTVPASATDSQQLVMAHVLYMDIVGYSKLPTDHQAQILNRLSEVVRATQEFCSKQANEHLIKLPTGDGMALVFIDDPEAHVKCAVEVSRALREQPDIKLRMGINTGLIYPVTDINERPNVAGTGINKAQRVMDCGDAGHILLSNTVAENLRDLSTWSNCIHDLGEAEVKHGAKVHVFNLFSHDFGNPELPERFRAKGEASARSSVEHKTEESTTVTIPEPAQVEPTQSYSSRQQEQRRIARKIIDALYEAWSKHTIISLNPVREEGGWEKSVFRTIVDRLESQHGLIRNYGTSYSFEITPAGVLYAEENEIVSKDVAAWHQQVRNHILAFLTDLYDKEGGRAHEHYEKIAANAPVKNRIEILKDLSLLTDLGYVEAASTSSFRITDEGLRYYRGANYEEII
jgi:class 3 adenylate cyclase